MAAPEPGSVIETYTLASRLRELGDGAVVSIEVRFDYTPPAQAPRRRRRSREPERLAAQPGYAGAERVVWVPFYDHGIGTTAGPHGSEGLIRQLQRRGAARFFEDQLAERGIDDASNAHRFRIYLLGYRGDEGVWPGN